MKKFRSFMSLLVLYLFPLVLIGLVVALAWVVAALGSLGGNYQTRFVLLVLIPVMAGAIAAVMEMVAVRPRPVHGPQLSREQSPALWAELDAMAKMLQTQVPDRVVLIPEVNAAVRQVGREREMLIGIPLFMGMSVAELRSILAHEMGHFAGGDTALAAKTLRARVLVKAARDHARPVIRWFFVAYYKVVELTSAASARDVELRADRASLAVAGTDTAATALERIPMVAAAWEFVVENRASMFEAAGARAPLYEAMIRARSLRGAELIELAHNYIREEQASRTDDHPPLSARIAELRSLPWTAGVPDGRSAVDLIVGGGQALAGLEAMFLGESLPLTTWNVVVDSATKREFPMRAAATIAHAMQSGALAEPSARALIASAGQDPVSFGRIFAGADASPSAAADASRNAMILVAQAALLEVDGVSALLGPDDEIVLVDKLGTQIPLTAWVADPAQLQLGLAGLGAQLDSLVAVREAAPLAGVLGGIPAVECKAWGKGVYDLLVCPDGLLAIDMEPEAMVRAIDPKSKPYEPVRLAQLASELDQVRERPGNRWVPSAAIATLEISKRSRIKLTKVDGEVLEIGAPVGLNEIGFQVANPLAHLLGNRLTDLRRGQA